VPLIRIRGPEDLLAMVPRLIGFHPERSLVMLTVGGGVRPVHARVDLPDPAPVDARAGEGQAGEGQAGDGVEALAEHLSGVAVDNAVTEVALVVYGGEARVARAVVDALTSRLTARGVDVACALRADGSRWWWLDDRDDEDDEDDDVDGGTPYDVALHPLTLAGVVDGTVVHADRRQLAASLVGTDADEIARVAALARTVLDDLGNAASGLRPGRHPRPVLALEAVWIDDLVRRFVADGERLDSGEVARLATAVTVSLDLRDVAWAVMSRPEAARHVDLWRDVVRRVPDDLRAGPAAVLGFAAWLSGQGALAWCAVECCQRLDPGHSLARLLTDLLAGAVPPAAWHPPPSDLLMSSS
jgi:hypothetical protein